MPLEERPLDPEQARLLLEEFAQQRAPVTLISAQPVAQGCLCKVSSEGGLLVEIAGEDPPVEAMLGLERLAVVELVRDGVLVQAKSRAVRWGPAGGGLARHLLLAPPSRVTRAQRRQYFRVPAEGTLTFPLAGGPLQLKVVDLSAGGACAVASPEEAQRLLVDEPIADVKVSFPPDDPFLMPSVVRYVRPDTGTPIFLRYLKGPSARAEERFRCGVEFLPPREGHRDRLYRLVARREREMLGRRQHLRTAVSGWVVLHLDGYLPRLRRMVDLSAGGLLVDLEGGETDAPLAVGTRLRSVEIRVPGETPLSAPGVVRRVNRHGEQVSCGIELELSTAVRQRIDQFIKHASSQRR